MHNILLRLLLLALNLALLGAGLCAQTPAANGRDWFVRAGAADGDGSRAAPFDDPWRALARCEAGDRIHVTGGQYLGRLGRAAWLIPFARVQLLGGYDAQFATRDPWQQPTQLCWNPESKNWPLYARLSSQAADVVVDGLVIDMQDQNQYADEQHSGRTGNLGEAAMQFSQPVTIRNCLLLNPGSNAINCVAGATIENNVIVNAVVWGIAVTGAVHGLERNPATIRGNTVLFSWDTEKPGAGGYGGAAVALRGPAIVADNVFAHSDNSAIYAAIAAEHLTITGNVFWKSRFANLSSLVGQQRAVVTDRDMELFEDVGLAGQSDNRVADPQVPFDAQVFTTGLAPACSLSMALDMWRAEGTKEAAGARRRSLPAPQFKDAAPSLAQTYTSVALTAWNRHPDAFDGKAIEMIAAIGEVANVGTVPTQLPREQIAGVHLYDPDGGGERVIGFYPKGSASERACDDATGWYTGRGKPARLHRVRGIAHAARGVIKGAMFVHAVERYQLPAAAVVRPVGRDWFVRAGATGGDGTREKPFRDPFQALERCEAGDSIHVATGDYTGKLKAGRWTIGMPYVALLGGYDAEFATRDPWQQPTRLFCAEDYQGQRTTYTLQGAEDHTGAIVDGFVFDKRLDNVYEKDGALVFSRSDKIEHLWLSRPGCVVRNCLFLNGAFGAVRLTGGQSVTNNVFVNHVLQTVWVERGHSNEPFEFRDNTAMFVWTTRPGAGHGASGSLLRLGSGVRAVVAGNVLAFADNDAVRIETDPRDVEMRDNLFTHNLWSNVQHMPANDVVDDLNFDRLADLGLQTCVGNRLGDAPAAIDAAWLALHRSVRDASEQQAPPAPPEKPAPQGNPFDDATALSAPPPPAPSPGFGSNPFDEVKPPAAGTTPGEPFAPVYDWRVALTLVGAQVEVGARRRVLPVAFTGVERQEATHSYTATTWEVALRAAAWAGLDGQRVQLDGAIKSTDSQYQLDDVSEKDYACYQFGQADGSGLPLRCYVKRGTKVQRVFEQAKGYTTAAPVELHRLRGVARERRQFVVEAAERLR